MPRFSDFHFDRLSFWLGFLAATLLWWLFSRVRPMLPVWRKQIKAYLESLRLKDQAGMDGYLRHETIRRAQHMHLAAPLFSLDEVLVPPQLIAPPPPADPDPEGKGFNLPIATRVIPYLPDWPELVAPFGIPTITAAQALQNGSHIAITGQPGSGKTVTLAHLAAQFGNRDAQLGPLVDAVPLLLHALDLDTTLVENHDPLENLTKAISQHASVVMQPQVQRFLKNMTQSGAQKAVLLLDGLDEVTPEQMADILVYLNALATRYPQIQMVVTASSDYLDGLTRAGFYPLAVAAWKPAQVESFVNRWSQLWTEQFLPEVKKQPKFVAHEIDNRLLTHWLTADAQPASPLEWTLRVWGAYVGDLSGSSLMALLDTHIARCLPSASFMPAIETLAYQMALKPAISLSFDEMDAILSAYQVPVPQMAVPVFDMEVDAATEAIIAEVIDSEADAAPAEPRAEGEEEPKAESGGKSKDKKSKKGRKDQLIAASQGEQLITAMLQAGVLIEHANHQIRFANLIFLGYLAGIHINSEEAQQMTQKTEWAVNTQALGFAAVCADDSRWIFKLLENPGQPVCHHLLMVARWLREAPTSADWRSTVMRDMAVMLQQEILPVGTRARLAGAFLLSRDPSTVRLYKGLLGSKSAVIRRLGLLGLGAVGAGSMIKDLLPLLNDPDRDVAATALMTLAATPGEEALKSLVDILLQGEEELRQIAAEALGQNEVVGRNILEEASGVDDLLTRRATVFGLVQVREEWARKLLEKIAVADAQWVVRNAAAQALETINDQASPFIPTPLPPASESPWLLTFAAKLGLGLAPDQPATNVLLLALKSGSPEEQLAALEYLRTVPEEGVAGSIYHLIYGEQEEIREPALLALWWIVWSGAKLPSPTQFGLG